MMEQIALLFSQTFDPKGEDPNAIIQEAVNQLDSFEYNTEFCQEVTNLVLSTAAFNDGIKKAAINYLRLAVYNAWDNLNPNSKQIIITFMPEAILKSTKALFPILKKMMFQLINITYLTQEWDFWPLISIGFTDPINEKNILVSLTIMNSVSKVFSRFSQAWDEEKQKAYDELTTQFLSLMTPYIKNSQNYLNLSICFNTLYHFSKIQMPPSFADQNLLILWLTKATEIQNENADPEYPLFILSALKFIRIYMYQYLNEANDDPSAIAYNVELMNSVIGCHENGVSSKIEPHIAFIIKQCLCKIKPTQDSIFADFPNFIQFVILPFFALTPQDVEEAENDPAAFIQNFHAVSTGIEDSRAILRNAFSQLDKKEELVSTLYGLFIQFMQNFTPEMSNDFYSICYLFSNVSRTAINPETAQQFYELIAPFFSHEYFIIRCGALLAIQNATTFPPELLTAVFNLLADSCLIVRYYAALAFTSLLKNLKEEMIPAIQKELSGHVLGILEIFFNLSETFDNYDFFTVLKLLVKYFGESMVEFAPKFVESVFGLFLSASKSETSSNLIMKTLSEFLEIFSGLIDPQSAQGLYDELMSSILQSIQSQQLSLTMIESVIQLTNNILTLVPNITPNYWEIEMMYLEVATHIEDHQKFWLIIDAIFVGLNNIVIRDKQTALQEQTITTLLSKSSEVIGMLLESHDCGKVFSFLASFLVVISESPFRISVADLLQLAVPSMETPALLFDANQLFSALLIYNAEEVFSIIGDDRPKILEMWANTIQLEKSWNKEYITRLDLFLCVLNKHSQVFSLDEFKALILKSIELLSNSLIENQIEEVFDDMQFIPLESPYMDVLKLSPIDHKQVVTQFIGLLNAAFAQLPEVLAQIQECCPDITEILQKIHDQL